MNETTIKIKASADGNDYTIEIVEEDAKNGTRIDQKTAQGILAMDQRLRDPEMQQMMRNFQNHPLANQMRRMMPWSAPGMGGMSPMAYNEMFR